MVVFGAETTFSVGTGRGGSLHRQPGSNV